MANTASEGLAAHRDLAQALCRPEAWPEPLPPDAAFQVIETHISTLLLAGNGAIKLKKPVALAFLDFSTPELRRHYCEEELRINRRTAPELYRAVLPVTGSPDAPRLGGTGPVLDWALWMHRFDNDQLYDHLARTGGLTAGHMDALAGVIARFHAGLPPAPAGYGSAAVARRWALENFTALADPGLGGMLPGTARARLRELAESSNRRLAAIELLMESRRSSGAVVECHGDLHLGNIVQHRDAPLLFDAIEFNPELRHLDRLDDVAFTFMDLLDHGLPRFAWRLLSQYLEHTGDYAGLPLLRWFATDRALVRAKVALLSARQAGPGDEAGLVAAAARRIGLAGSLARPAPPRLILTSGVSGSGKSTVALALAEAVGGVRIRSDVERKRLHGMPPTARVADPALLYNAASTAGTYRRLGSAAAAALAGGISAIVDAACLRRHERDAFRTLARDRQVPFTLVECRASETQLRERIAGRMAHQQDPSDADTVVLDRQLRSREPLDPEELTDAVCLDTGFAPHELPDRVDALLRQLGSTPLPRGEDS